VRGVFSSYLPLHNSPRRGLTLIELLVTMTIILIISTVLLAFAPGFRDKEKVPRGADSLQGWLATARQWAKRDRMPTGIRLVPYSGTNPAYSATTTFIELQYIQQPPNFTSIVTTPGTSGSATGATCPISVSGTTVTSVSGTTVTLAPPNTASCTDFSGGVVVKTSWPVLANDFLVVQGTIHQISSVNSASTLTLLSAATCVTSTTDYYIVRAPRPFPGEASLKMPQDVVIDFRNIPGTPSPGTPRSTLVQTNTHYDLVYSPSGELLTPAGSNLVMFWICDNSKLGATGTVPPPINDDELIAVNGRTGQVASHPVNLSGSAASTNTYYSFCLDGRSSGM